VGWESRVWNRKYGDESNCWKADDSQKSFLFTLKNPHNVAARRFALNAEKKYAAICCDSECGPCFGNDIAVYNECNANAKSYAYGFGISYTSDAGLYSSTFFTGSGSFQVKEIEVFEITD
jgi:hypothetical protein